MPIVIKKKVSLDFLGEDYKDAELIFRSMPISDFEKILDELPKSNPRYTELIQEAETGELSDDKQKELVELQSAEAGNNKKNIQLILEYLKRYFISGKFPNADTGELEDVEDKEELDGLDQATAIKCFGIFTGQDDPKVEKPSTMPSSTEP